MQIQCKKLMQTERKKPLKNVKYIYYKLELEWKTHNVFIAKYLILNSNVKVDERTDENIVCFVYWI